MSTYDKFDKGLTEEEFILAKERYLNELFEKIKGLHKPYSERERLKLCSEIRRMRSVSYQRYFEKTHVMTSDGIK